MQKEDLIKLLNDAGLDNEGIVALLNEVLADLQAANENVDQPQDNIDIVENDDDKEKRIFGI